MQGAHPFALSSKWMDSGDDLNLAGVLNVLDGVVDCPNRILVMTTNHPEKLDPALIRPGRVNKRLFLGYMTPCDAGRMVKHYFSDALDCELEQLQDLLHTQERRLVPAQLESVCAEHDTVASLISHFEEAEIECEDAQEYAPDHDQEVAPTGEASASSSEKFSSEKFEKSFENYEVVALQDGSSEASVGPVDTPKLGDAQDSQDSGLGYEFSESPKDVDDAPASKLRDQQAAVLERPMSPVSLGMASEDVGELSATEVSQIEVVEGGVNCCVPEKAWFAGVEDSDAPPARASGVFGSITEIEVAK